MLKKKQQQKNIETYANKTKQNRKQKLNRKKLKEQKNKNKTQKNKNKNWANKQTMILRVAARLLIILVAYKKNLSI